MLVGWFATTSFAFGLNEKEEWARLSQEGSPYASLVGPLTGLSYGVGPEAPRKPGGNFLAIEY